MSWKRRARKCRKKAFHEIASGETNARSTVLSPSCHAPSLGGFLLWCRLPATLGFVLPCGGKEAGPGEESVGGLTTRDILVSCRSKAAAEVLLLGALTVSGCVMLPRIAGLLCTAASVTHGFISRPPPRTPCGLTNSIPKDYHSSSRLLLSSTRDDDTSVVDPLALRSNPSSARPVLPQNISLTILYEDKDVLCLDKAAGMVVQYASGSVENAVVHYLNQTGGSSTSGGSWYASPSWPWKSDRSFEGMVHRLDKGTSGILLVAKHPQASRNLRLAFAERRVRKTYLAIAEGLPSDRNLLVEKKPSAQRIPSTNDVEVEEEPAPHQKRLSKEIKDCGRNYTRALELFHQANDPSASCLSAAISVCRRAGQRDLALSLMDSSIRLAKTKVTKPNLLSFKTCTSLCAQDPPLCDKAIDLVVRDMPACGHALHPHCVSSAISVCGRVNRLVDALDLLKRIEAQEEGVVESCRMAAAKACERCGAHDMARDLLREDAAMHPNPKDSDKRSSTLGKPIQVDAPIEKIGPRLMGVVATGREARSIVTPLAYNVDTGESFNSIVIETGRTHQIRVHMADVLGCPLVGDNVYGHKSSLRIMLHATELVVPHPTTGTTLRIVCPPPPDFALRAREIILSGNSTANDPSTKSLMKYLK